MGLLDRFFKKENKDLMLVENKLKTAFSLVSADIKHVQKDVKKLHAGQELTQQDIHNLSLWLGYLKKNTEEIEKNFKQIGAWLVYLNEQNEKSQKRIENHDFELKKLKQHVATGVATGVATPKTHELGPKTKESEKHVATGVGNVGNARNVGFATRATPKTLSNPLKVLLNFMISIGEPMSYSAISQKLGKSKITVRVNMNRLKRQGLVEEFTTPDGSKLFAAKNAEKIKKLYNVDIIS
jgi:biotin operon repressor